MHDIVYYKCLERMVEVQKANHPHYPWIPSAFILGEWACGV